MNYEGVSTVKTNNKRGKILKVEKQVCKRNTKRGQMGGPNNFSCGGQFLEKLFKYAILPTLKKFLKLLGGPCHQRSSAPGYMD